MQSLVCHCKSRDQLHTSNTQWHRIHIPIPKGRTVGIVRRYRTKEDKRQHETPNPAAACPLSQVWFRGISRLPPALRPTTQVFVCSVLLCAALPGTCLSAVGFPVSWGLPSNPGFTVTASLSGLPSHSLFLQKPRLYHMLPALWLSEAKKEVSSFL